MKRWYGLAQHGKALNYGGRDRRGWSCRIRQEKRKWHKLDTDDVIIETLDAHYEVESLRNLDDYNTIRYGRHVKNYALQNVSIIKYLTGGRNAGKNFKIF